MARQGLDAVAGNLAEGLNAQHKAGFTQSGAQGGDFFSVSIPAVPDPANPSAATMTVQVGQLSKLKAGDYVLSLGGSGYQLVNAKDQSVLSTASSLTDLNAFTAGLGFTLQTDMQPGDSFTIQVPHLAGALSLGVQSAADIAAASASPALTGDNGNILMMANLQFANQGAGTSSALSDYAQLVGRVGSKTRELQLTSTSADKIHSQAQAALQNASGVNLDEEAANLIRYQQSYQAAAKIIQMVQQMFDSVLQMGR